MNSIGQDAFFDCPNLSTVTVQATMPPTLAPASAAFDSCAARLQIAVPAASANAYKAASGWSTYAAQIVSM